MRRLFESDSILACLVSLLLVGCGGGVKNISPSANFSRDQAIAKVKTEVLLMLPADKQAKVAALCRSTLLNAGDTIQPVGSEGWSGGPVTVPTPAWFFLVDHAPYSKFVHHVQYVFVEAQTGALTARDALWWPRINGKDLWERQDDRLANTNPERIWPESSVLPTRTASRAASPCCGSISRSREPDPCAGKTIRKVAFLVGGSNETAMNADVAEMRDLYAGIGFETHTHDPAGSSLSLLVEDIKTTIEKLGPCDKFLFYFSGHGSETGVFFGPKDGGERWNYTGNIGSPDHPTLPSMVELLKKVPAGHIEIFIDACHSGAIVTVLNAAFPPTGSSALVGATSTDGKQEAGYTNTGNLFVSPGSDWSKAFRDCLKQHLKNAPKDITPGQLEAIERTCRQQAAQQVAGQKPQPLDNGK